MRQTFRILDCGYTLTELLITMAITSIITGAIVSSFITQRRSYMRQEQITAMMQNVRAAMDMTVREVRMTGYGVPQSLSTWIDPAWVAGFTRNPLITQGSGSDPDTITIASSIDATTLSAAADHQADTLTLASSEEVKKFKDSKGNLSPKKKIIFIGRNEIAEITAISGKTLTIDTDRTTSGNQGLGWSYPSGTLVELLKIITYTVVDNTLKRNENTGAGAQPVAENIEDFQVTLAGNIVTITLIGKTTKPEVGYTHPIIGDAHRRVALTSQVTLRNLGL